MARDVVGRAVDAVGISRLGPRIDRHFEKSIHRLHITGLGLTNADLTEVEYGDLQSDIEPAHQKSFVGSLFELIGVSGVENVDEAADLGETVGLREYVELDARYLEIDAPRDRVRLNPCQRLNMTGHGRQRIRK